MVGIVEDKSWWSLSFVFKLIAQVKETILIYGLIFILDFLPLDFLSCFQKFCSYLFDNQQNNQFI